MSDFAAACHKDVDAPCCVLVVVILVFFTFLA